MQTFTITSPNTCGLCVIGTNIGYVGSVGSVTYAPDTATFSEYLTPEDAAAAALVIDPSYDTSNIFGPIPYTVDTETGSGDYLYGDNVTLEYVVSSTLAGTTIAYQWYDEGNLALPGQTSSTLNLGGASTTIEGSYTCIATLTATDGSNRVATTSGSFSVTAYPVVGEFTLTRSGNNITTGLFSHIRGFVAATATIEVPAIPLTISYDPVDGFKTTGSPLLALDQVAELYINGEFVRTFTVHAVDGTFSYNFAS